ncbi:ABC transporter permease [Acuticoccus sp. MNP-M23]|uniref:ABC transporter permease n=1 Tax=Acuticoccus sp. MNP-M23 TaxID=3072793 RepID=UPI002815FDFA|nr:ABC transporter permease [Acuticoccus sp. MNP-M23]WMS44526.1 ABC transporter permease [Acuticoccus sp. MNP-M23]
MRDTASDVRPGVSLPKRVTALGRAGPLASLRLGGTLSSLAWGAASVGIFCLVWEFCWLVGLADPRLLPPPHIFLGDLPNQAKFFNTATRWEVGVSQSEAPSGTEAVMITVAATSARVIAGLAIASFLAITAGILMRYFALFEKLTMPTVMLLSAVSPVAWLPVAVFLFGIGNGPAIFMVVIALFFHMVIATVAHIDNVPKNFIHVARTMGATKRQVYARVIVPAILPPMLMVLRLNLFGAWMVVLIAETTGVGYGLGQIIMLARNTFNPPLVFCTIALIGVFGFLTDWSLRTLQRRVLYWIPNKGAAHGF